MMQLYHGSTQVVKHPEIRTAKYHKDFYFGFYCTSIESQAVRWATRFGDGFINVYEYKENAELRRLRFEKMTDEWLDFIVSCRNGNAHEYDIVEGPMADDSIFNYVQSIIDGKITRDAFWNLAKFKYPTHQISFHTIKALQTLTFIDSRSVHE